MSGPRRAVQRRYGKSAARDERRRGERLGPVDEGDSTIFRGDAAGAGRRRGHGARGDGRARGLASLTIAVIAASGACSGGAPPPPAPSSVVSIAPAAAAPDAAPPEQAPAARVAVGDRHSCVVDASRRVKCWGANDHGQLGDGSRNGSAAPVTVAAIEAAIDVGAAVDRTCALTAGGTVWCWGDQGGRDELRPAVIEGLSGAAAISVQGARVCAVLRSGAALCYGTQWLGDGEYEHDGPPVVAEVAGVHDAAAISGTCVLSFDGTVKCWGPNPYGEVGDGTRDNRTTPVRVQDVDDATAIAAGSAHTCVVRRSGKVACWGHAEAGQGGDGRPAAPHETAFDVPGIEGARAITASPSGPTTCALLAGGEVTCWGGGVLGTLAAGNEDNGVDLGDARVLAMAPARVPELRDVAAVAAGMFHACARDAAGAVRCWGLNTEGQLGTGVAAMESGLVHVAEVSGAVRVAAGDGHACALGAGGAVWCWGDGRRGQLGDGTLQSRGTPARVAGLDDAIDLSADEDHTCAVRCGGAVVCWGADVPQPGGEIDTIEIHRTPAEVAGVRDAKRISTNRATTCVRLGSGRAACWGQDTFGALGVTGGVKGAAITPVTGLASAATVTTSTFGGCATTTAGALWCWGAGEITAWEPGGPDDPPVNEAAIVKPVAVKSVRDAVVMGNYSARTCVVRKGGHVACWDTETRALAPPAALTAADEVAGLDDAADITRDLVVRRSGAVGMITGATAPAKFALERVAPALTDAVTAARGSAHFCAVRKAGDVACWGDDYAGQLGAGSRGRSEKPVRVVGLP